MYRSSIVAVWLYFDFSDITGQVVLNNDTLVINGVEISNKHGKEWAYKLDY